METLPQYFATGRWYTSAGDGLVANLTRQDAARTAAFALASSEIQSGRYDIAEPELLNVTEIADKAKLFSIALL